MSLEIHLKRPPTFEMEQDTKEYPQQLDAVIEEFQNQALHPPSGDETIASCYSTVVEMIQEKTEIREYFSDVIAKREFTPEHFVNLFFRAVQFHELFIRQTPQYPHKMDTREVWQEHLEPLLTDQTDDGQIIKELLLTKDTTTTKYQRYIGAAIALNAFFPDKAVQVADFGCGGNHGLPGFKGHVPFENFTDETPDKLATTLSERAIKIERGLAVDKEDPNDPEAKAWRYACSFYPKELSQAMYLTALETSLANVKGIEFLQGDLLNLAVNHADGTLPSKTFDAVIMSTMLYQHNSENRQKIIESAKKSLSEDGIIIVQDFAIKDEQDPGKLKFIQDWFKTPWSYRTFVCGERTNWEMKEILQSENGRSRRIKQGEDFDILMQPQTKKVN